MKEFVVNSPETLAKAMELMAKSHVIGYDTEFVSEESFRPELCLVQLAIPGNLFVVDPFSSGPLDGMWQLLTEGSREIVVHSGREEIRICQAESSKVPSRLFDIQIASGLIGIGYPSGYAALVSQLTGNRLDKQETLTDWRVRPLTREQIRYAFDDVRYLLECHDKIRSRLDRLGRFEWADEEHQQLVKRSRIDEPVGERWRRVKGTGNFDRRRLAMVRELYHWRDQLAQKRNRPPRSIMRDELISEIIRRNPKNPSEVTQVRGTQQRDAQGIFEALEIAKSLPLDQLPQVEVNRSEPSQVALISQVLGGILGDYCTRESLTPSLVATVSDMKDLVRSQMEKKDLDEDNSLAKGWRKSHVLPVLRDFLEGRSSLRLASIEQEAPFAYDNPHGGTGQKGGAGHGRKP